MSLLDIAKSIKAEGFDPRKDSANGPDPIPAGEYPVILKAAAFHLADSGWESIRYQFEVRGGEYNGRTEFASFGTLEDWKGKSLKWAVERTMKFFIKAITLCGDNMTGEEVDGKALEEALHRKAVGSYYKLIITENKGKDGTIYRSYDLEEDSFQQPQGMEIDDDDLPF